MASASSAAAAGAPSPSGSAAASDDAFRDKESRKAALLALARARYLQIHPDFVPPAKAGAASPLAGLKDKNL